MLMMLNTGASMIDVKLPPMRRGDPTWSTALRYPRQGFWTEHDFFAMEGQDNGLKELSNGYLEVLPMPSLYHQDIAIYILDILREFLRTINDRGRVSMAPCPIRFTSKRIREPDVFYLSEKRLVQTGTYPTGADFVAEVVSGGNIDRRRDLITKRKEYAKAGIKEYWIVDPKKTVIIVLTLNKATKKYKVHGKYTAGQTATSKMFKGFSVEVNQVFKKR